MTCVLQKSRMVQDASQGWTLLQDYRISFFVRRTHHVTVFIIFSGLLFCEFSPCRLCIASWTFNATHSNSKEYTTYNRETHGDRWLSAILAVYNSKLTTMAPLTLSHSSLHRQSTWPEEDNLWILVDVAALYIDRLWAPVFIQKIPLHLEGNKNSSLSHILYPGRLMTNYNFVLINY